MCCRGVELRSVVKHLQLLLRAGLEPRTSGFLVQRPNCSSCLYAAFSHTKLVAYKKTLQCSIQEDITMYGMPVPLNTNYRHFCDFEKNVKIC